MDLQAGILIFKKPKHKSFRCISWQTFFVHFGCDTSDDKWPAKRAPQRDRNISDRDLSDNVQTPSRSHLSFQKGS